MAKYILKHAAQSTIECSRGAVVYHEQVCRFFKVDATLLRTRHLGGAVSDVRKVFACRACRIYRAPVAKVRAFPRAGGAAVSAMAAKGKLPAEKYGLAK